MTRLRAADEEMAMDNHEKRKTIIRWRDLQAMATAVGEICMTKQHVLLPGGVA